MAEGAHSSLTSDLTSQRDALLRMGVRDANIYVDHGLTGTNRPRSRRQKPSTHRHRTLTLSRQATARGRRPDEEPKVASVPAD